MKRFDSPMRGLALCLLSLMPAWAAAQMLRVESLQGEATLTRGQAQLPLAVNRALQTDDVIAVGADAHLNLRLGRHGILELGPGAQLSVDRLPHASYADDLRTVFQLRRGFLRLIWKQPALDINWPLFVYLAQGRSSLSSGEYFFDAGSSSTAVCVAEGQLALASPRRADPQLLPADACYQLAADAAPRSRQRSPEDWIALRQGQSIDAALWAPAAADAAVAAPPLQAPAVSAVPAPRPASRPVEKPAAAASVRARTEPAARAQAGPPAQPAPIARAPAAAPGSWAINLASLPDAASAQQEAQKVRKAGFTPTVLPAEVKGRTWYRVQVAGLASRAEAQAMATRLRAAGFAQTWVMQP